MQASVTFSFERVPMNAAGLNNSPSLYCLMDGREKRATNSSHDICCGFGLLSLLQLKNEMVKVAGAGCMTFSLAVLMLPRFLTRQRDA